MILTSFVKAYEITYCNSERLIECSFENLNSVSIEDYELCELLELGFEKVLLLKMNSMFSV